MKHIKYKNYTGNCEIWSGFENALKNILVFGFSYISKQSMWIDSKYGRQ